MAFVKFKGSMDLATDYCIAKQAVLLALLCGHSRKVLEGCHSRITVDARVLAGCLLNEGARHSSARQAIMRARYDEGTLATNRNAATREKRCHNSSPS